MPFQSEGIACTKIQTGRKGDALLASCVWWGWDVEGSEADRAMYTVQKHLGSMSQ